MVLRCTTFSGAQLDEGLPCAYKQCPYRPPEFQAKRKETATQDEKKSRYTPPTHRELSSTTHLDNHVPILVPSNRNPWRHSPPTRSPSLAPVSHPNPRPSPQAQPPRPHDSLPSHPRHGNHYRHRPPPRPLPPASRAEPIISTPLPRGYAPWACAGDPRCCGGAGLDCGGEGVAWECGRWDLGGHVSRV